ncbi:MAG: hypothetical protein O3C27_10745 [Actinomycetota bacterium]|nr:hypothetical protein [Actinomycetota bacterium]
MPPETVVVVSPLAELVELASSTVVVVERVLDVDESDQVVDVVPPGQVGEVTAVEPVPSSGNVVGASGPGPVLTVGSALAVVGVGWISVVGTSVDVSSVVVDERVVGTVARVDGADDPVAVGGVVGEVVMSSSFVALAADKTSSPRSIGTATMSPDRTRSAW